METKIYKPTPGNLLLRRVVGIIFTVTGAGLGCAFAFFGLLFLPALFSSEETSLQGGILALFFPGVGLLMGGLFVVVGLMVALSGRNDRVELTPKALNLIEGKATTSLRLSEIANLTSQWRLRRRRRRSRGHWALLITDRLGHTIELGISQGGYLATFDARSILQDLKPRLPATANIDPQVEAYLATGQMSA